MLQARTGLERVIVVKSVTVTCRTYTVVLYGNQAELLQISPKELLLPLEIHIHTKTLSHPFWGVIRPNHGPSQGPHGPQVEIPGLGRAPVSRGETRKTQNMYLHNQKNLTAFFPLML